MSSFPGRKIIAESEGFDWYMNPEGLAYKEYCTPLNIESPKIIGISGDYDGKHSIYRNIPARFSLADIILFHPKIDSKIINPYKIGILELIKILPCGLSLSAESYHRASKLLDEKNYNLTLPSLLTRYLEKVVDSKPQDISEGSVAIGLGRILSYKSYCYILSPMGNTSSGYSTISRIIEELLMISTLFEVKKPESSKVSRDLALELIDFGLSHFGPYLWNGIKISLLAHLVRRSEAPYSPDSLPEMMETVAKKILSYEEKYEK